MASVRCWRRWRRRRRVGRARMYDRVLKFGDESLYRTILFARNLFERAAVTRSRRQTYRLIEDVRRYVIGMSDIGYAHPRANGFVSVHTPVNGVAHHARSEEARDCQRQHKRQQHYPLPPTQSFHHNSNRMKAREMKSKPEKIKDERMTIHPGQPFFHPLFSPACSLCVNACSFDFHRAARLFRRAWRRTSVAAQA